ncbi:MAG: YggS family pyridoxal phosphate-dependent enzyme [Phycisphaerales bacterium]
MMSETSTMSLLPTLKERYEEVRRRIDAAARRSERDPGDIMLVAVTKFADPEDIRQLIELGHADFGENRVQNLSKRVASIEEFLDRHRTMTSSRPVSMPERIRWHMIGHLQRNKVSKVIDLVSLVHSVDTLRLAEELQDAAMKRDLTIDILLQVNTSSEKSKYGIAPVAAPHLAELIDTMIHLRLRGLMTMAPLTSDESRVRSCFTRCRELFDEMKKSGVGGPDFNILSMGMTNDFETAIECGANIVRVGTAIFGEKAAEDDSDAATG